MFVKADKCGLVQEEGLAILYMIQVGVSSIDKEGYNDMVCGIMFW